MSLPLRLAAEAEKRTWQTAILVGVTALLTHAALVAIVRGNPRVLAVAGDLFLLLEYVAAAVLASYARRSVCKVGRWPGGWTLLVLALWFAVLGQALWLIYEIIYGLVPQPSLVDPFSLAFYPLFALGLITLPTAPRSSQERLKLGLEMGTALLAGSLLFGVLGPKPIVANEANSPVGLVVSLAYPAADVVLFWALIVSLYRRPSVTSDPPLNLLLTGALIKLLADSVYSYSVANGSYRSGDFPDLVISAALLYFSLAAVRQMMPSGWQTPERAVSDADGVDPVVRMVTWRSWVPYLSLLSAFALLVWNYYHPTMVSFPALAALVGTIIVLLGARQVLALREAEGLYKSQHELAARRRTEQTLRQARDELERRVQERTHELQVANAALEHKIAQHQEAEARLQMSLNEKEVLLKEVHHRVKNNLQVISSLLGLQSRKATDRFASDLLRESQGRVRTMALIHQKLYASTDLGRIDFQDYLQTLLNSLFDSYRVYPGTVSLHIEVAPAWLSIDTAVSCGLIVNELVSNALKHAFPDGRKGSVSVRLANLDGRALRLSVEDDGVGLPPGIDYRRTESLGLQLAVTLTNQLDGTIAVDSTSGAAFHITFPAC